ncbi:cupin domain-containing protein [Streptomyces orinoci]|uniref:Cupin domain-containing protein n=1 Tax=Streptomyces orinoci TaxID=67339 RepID=A0ABV3JY56_STRON|nr:cupin domain-containing protein [Streptomyces orinoci]
MTGKPIRLIESEEAVHRLSVVDSPAWYPGLTSTSVVILQPGEELDEHSLASEEELLYVISGELTVESAAGRHTARAHQGLLVPTNTRHRARNNGPAPSLVILHQLTGAAP